MILGFYVSPLSLHMNLCEFSTASNNLRIKNDDNDDDRKKI